MNAQVTPAGGIHGALRRGRRHVSRPDTHRQVLREALSMGAARISEGRVRHALHGRCSDPRQIEWTHRSNASKDERLVWLTPRLPILEQTVRCRKCPECLRARAAHWSLRAQSELQRSQRSWFVTLTLSPDEHWKVECRAQLKYGDGWSRLAEAEKFRRLSDAAAPLLTKWLKRVRKESGAKLRYLLVVEAHKSGLPHWHLLMHEADEAQPVRKRTLQQQWWHGFSQAKLVDGDPKTARYVCKYLAKSALARVRASGGYGSVRPRP